MPAARPNAARRARSLRARGLTQRAIADQLGVSRTTVARWLDPAYADRERHRSREAKRRRRAPCERCGLPISYDRRAGLCRACRGEQALHRHEQVARLYASGLEAGEIARRVGLSPGYVRLLIGCLARAGRLAARYPLRDRASVRARDRRVRALHRRGRPRGVIARQVGLRQGSLSTVFARHRR